jgi:hypothetical protein
MTALRLRWFARFEFPDPAEEDRWYQGPDGIGMVIDLLAGTALWSRLDVLGSGYQDGEPLGELAAVKRRVAAGPDVYTLAHGAPRGAAFSDEAELAVTIDVSPGQVDLQVSAEGAELDALGARVLDDVIAVLAGLHDAWRGRANLVWGAAVPVLGPEVVYRRPRPPRAAKSRRPLDAIVDVVARASLASDVFGPVVAESSAIAAATPPAAAARTEHAGLVVLRWVDDPRNLAEVAAAAAAHEVWMTGVIDSEPSLGWNELGDREVIVSSARREPPLRAVDRTAGVAYVDAPAVDAPEAWAPIEALAAAPPAGIHTLVLVAPSRMAMLALADRSRAAGMAKVIYVSGSTLWDADPPGLWLANPGEFNESGT